ncbi:imidazoleglycerol-phosphate dehydratase HisB [Desulforegula conservatrix]|uniref:imidazoleglycerol-phosphate dehydratase HisB n=1 Tax=Desulforegula conservatrix TaxID=153026 RepID=UPI00041D9458|nr:imidazoleglycerol-phosphate dehydratase HisB [Desulforegula conservatrix]
MAKTAAILRETGETRIKLSIDLEGSGKRKISTGIPFFNHMLDLFSAHGFFDLEIDATGDIEVDFHHTVEDVGIVLGDAVNSALGDKKGIKRYGHAVTPMDETLTSVSMDVSNRPFLVFNVPEKIYVKGPFDVYLAKEFFRAFAGRAGITLHINVHYGENEHHIIESIFKACGRALSEASSKDDRISGVRSTKGVI